MSNPVWFFVGAIIGSVLTQLGYHQGKRHERARQKRIQADERRRLTRKYS